MRYMKYFFTLLLTFGVGFFYGASASPFSDAQAGYASAVAVADDVVFIGEARNTYRPGTVYVYRNDGSEWVEFARLTASDGEMGDRFGSSLAVAGNTLLVGAPARDENGQGAVYVFWRTERGAWEEVAKLTAEGSTATDGFGSSVAIEGDQVLVGAPLHGKRALFAGQGGGERSGLVYAFRRNEQGQWTQQGTLTGSSVRSESQFGSALALHQGQAFVSAARQEAGAVYVFDFDAEAGAWAEASVLTGSTTEAGHAFGSTLSVAEGLLLVGAPQHDRATGAVFLFEPDEENGAWEETGRLLPFDGSRQFRFGTALAYNGREVLVGAPGAHGGAGALYVFDRNEAGQWAGAIKQMTQESRNNQFFASTLAANAQVAVLGVSGDDNGSGSAVILERAADGTFERQAWVEQVRLRSEPEALPSVTGAQVNCESGKASMFDCEGVDLVSFIPIKDIGGERGINLNDIWGWTDPVTGKEYALVGRTDGMSFVDITDPANPRYVGNLPKTPGSRTASWRDMKVYKDHVFVVADGAGEHGMQVFDLTLLRDFDGVPVTFEPSAHYDRINSAHNIVINEETGFAYTVGNSQGGETCGGGLHMIDIREPREPKFAGCFAHANTGRVGTGYTHDAQCVSYKGPDADYTGREICFGSNETALSIADVTDKANPVAISSASYPNVSYTHQGWLTEDHRHLFVNDELDELSGNVTQTRTLIWDVTDLDDPQLVKEYMWGPTSTDHNLYIRGNLMYQSNYASGLRVHDISDPNNPVEVGFFDTTPVGSNGAGFTGSWSNYPFFKSGVIAVSSIGEGLFLLKKQDTVGM